MLILTAVALTIALMGFLFLVTKKVVRRVRKSRAGYAQSPLRATLESVEQLCVADEPFKTSPDSLFKYGTTQTLKADAVGES